VETGACWWLALTKWEWSLFVSGGGCGGEFLSGYGCAGCEFQAAAAGAARGAGRAHSRTHGSLAIAAVDAARIDQINIYQASASGHADAAISSPGG